LAHRFLGFVLAGSVLLHVAVKLPVIRAALARPVAADEPSGGGLSRRGLLTATGAGVTLAVVTTVGQSVGRLEPLGLLAPRRPSSAPQRVPVNKTAAQAGVRPVSTGWRLEVRGPRPFTLGLAELDAATATARLPIACVEGWSVDARWRGLRLLDVVRRAGGDADSTVYVHSLQRHGAYSHSLIEGPQLAGALLATHLNGARLDLDHGYPVRLIAPDRAGVLNTKWLAVVEVR
jgi:DMSO/TMAO reductase YedYZ molybdopterin-dependent catalytic subunit